MNDSPEPVAGTLTVERRRFDGKSQGQLQTEVKLEPGKARRCLLTTDLGPIYLRNEFLHARFVGREATYLLIGERYLHLPRAELTATPPGEKIDIFADVLACDVLLWMEGVTGAVFEDDLFDIPPGQERTIAVVDPAGGRKLVVRALNAEPIRVNFDKAETPWQAESTAVPFVRATASRPRVRVA